MAQGEDGPCHVSGGIRHATAPLASLRFLAVFWWGRVCGEGAVGPAAAAIKLPIVSAPFPRPLG